MSTTSILMANPKAADLYLQIAANASPTVLADNYLSAKIEDDKNLCLAIECHLRELAQIRFHKPEVLAALQAMERHKLKRKRGTSAPKHLQDIADQIERNYASGDYMALPYDKIQFSLVTTDGAAIKIRCKNMPGAVAQVVAKYRQGLPKSRSGRYGTENAIVN